MIHPYLFSPDTLPPPLVCGTCTSHYKPTTRRISSSLLFRVLISQKGINTQQNKKKPYSLLRKYNNIYNNQERETEDCHTRHPPNPALLRQACLVVFKQPRTALHTDVMTSVLYLFACTLNLGRLWHSDRGILPLEGRSKGRGQKDE